VGFTFLVEPKGVLGGLTKMKKRISTTKGMKEVANQFSVSDILLKELQNIKLGCSMGKKKSSELPKDQDNKEF
jgi:hypothetical protein